MQKRTIIGTLILAIAVAGCFLLFQFAAPAEARSKGAKDSTCPKIEKESKLIWENLSHQFFSPI